MLFHGFHRTLWLFFYYPLSDQRKVAVIMYETQAENALFCIVPDILYTTVDGIPLYLDIIQPDPLPEERMPVVIYIHGGGWMGGHRKGERNTLLAAHGFFA